MSSCCEVSRRCSSSASSTQQSTHKSSKCQMMATHVIQWPPRATTCLSMVHPPTWRPQRWPRDHVLCWPGGTCGVTLHAAQGGSELRKGCSAAPLGGRARPAEAERFLWQGGEGAQAGRQESQPGLERSWQRPRTGVDGQDPQLRGFPSAPGPWPTVFFSCCISFPGDQRPSTLPRPRAPQPRVALPLPLACPHRDYMVSQVKRAGRSAWDPTPLQVDAGGAP